VLFADRNHAPATCLFPVRFHPTDSLVRVRNGGKVTMVTLAGRGGDNRQFDAGRRFLPPRAHAARPFVFFSLLWCSNRRTQHMGGPVLERSVSYPLIVLCVAHPDTTLSSANKRRKTFLVTQPSDFGPQWTVRLSRPNRRAFFYKPVEHKKLKNVCEMMGDNQNSRPTTIKILDQRQ
jgi:hypothetical protein